ncbi:bacterio-opsin activator domain-containing protein [Halopiger djelfimassiliensis]|uniref:bacterio-opsin activator domain-containing protein n=1 Tax=Halopiger djelfimassiliensis TaxID=1293047 RepID=UPI0006780169|nr:bacterio-opsin activator domain-containing protein [Halopiger djelfimassiliensis]
MSGEPATAVGDVRRVLVVGDSGAIETTAEALAAAFDPASLLRESTVSDALERLEDSTVNCVVCEFPAGSNGTALETLADRTAVPIVAVVDDSEIDRALEAGATDVITPADTRSVVVARVGNAAQRYRLTAAGPDRRYRSILETADAVVWVVDPDGEITYASPAIESRLGYTPDELEHTGATEVVHPEDREPFRETLDDVSTAPLGASERVELRIGTANGTWRTATLTFGNRLDDPLVNGIVVTVSVPGTGAGDTGVASPEEGETVRAALDRLSDPFFALGPDWELQYSNPAARRLFDGEPVPGTVIWELLDGTIREPFAERLREARATESIVRFETPLPTADGRLEVTVSPDGDGVSVSVREHPADAATGTDREVVRERDRLALLESTVDALDDGVAVLEGETIRLANARLFELADDEGLVGTDLDALFDDDLAATVRERLQSPVVRWMDPIRGTLETPTGDRPVEVFVTPLPEADRTLCVVRDGQQSATAVLSTVRRTIGTLREAETRSEIRQSVVDGVLACTDAAFVGWYLLEDDRLTPAAVATPDAASPIEPPPIEDDGTPAPIAVLRETDEATVYDRAALEPLLARSGLRAERVLAVPVDDHGIVLATSTEPMAFETLETGGPGGAAPVETMIAAGSIALDRLERHALVRTCREERSRIESSLRRWERLREIERTLLEAETRDDVERRLCEAIVSLDPGVTAGSATGDIELAWLGHVAAGSETVTPRTWAGRDGDFLESTTAPLAADADEPTGRAAARREPAIVEDLETLGEGPAGAFGDPPEGSDDDGTGAWRRQALERGFRSVLSVPIEHDEFLYGTLTVYADRPSAFDSDARLALEHLAAIAGYVIESIERKRALLSDSVTELEIVLRDESEPLSTVARRLAQRLDVRTVVPRSSGGSTVYCTVPKVDEDAFRNAIDTTAAVETVRFVGNGRDGSPVELVLDESTIAETIAAHGGVLRTVRPVDDRTRIVLELPSTVDVRSFVRMLERTHPGTELIARRERDRSTRPPRAFDAELRDRLSERQWRTLETAYYGGFFEWPRESTGEEVAESLGVSQPTFSRHLRIAQRKLFELLFDERPGEDRA